MAASRDCSFKKIIFGNLGTVFRCGLDSLPPACESSVFSVTLPTLVLFSVVVSLTGARCSRPVLLVGISQLISDVEHTLQTSWLSVFF